MDGQTTSFTTARSAEVGLRFANEHLVGSGAGFATWVSDDRVLDHATGRNEAVPGTFRKGFAVEATYRPREWILLAGSGTYTSATFQESSATYHEGEALPYVPRFVARLDATFAPRLARLLGRELIGRLSAGATLLHDRPLPYSKTGSDVFQLDATAGLRLREIELLLVAHRRFTRYFGLVPEAETRFILCSVHFAQRVR